jgi:hypothetical protein
MKKILIILFLFASLIANATYYYVRPGGNDSRIATEKVISDVIGSDDDGGITSISNIWYWDTTYSHYKPYDVKPTVSNVLYKWHTVAGII